LCDGDGHGVEHLKNIPTKIDGVKSTRIRICGPKPGASPGRAAAWPGLPRLLRKARAELRLEIFRTARREMSKFAKFYEDDQYYEAKVGGMVGDQYLVQFIGYEDDDWQLTYASDIRDSLPEDGGNSTAEKLIQAPKQQKESAMRCDGKTSFQAAKPAQNSKSQSTSKNLPEVKKDPKPSNTVQRPDQSTPNAPQAKKFFILETMPQITSTAAHKSTPLSLAATGLRQNEEKVLSPQVSSSAVNSSSAAHNSRSLSLATTGPRISEEVVSHAVHRDSVPKPKAPIPSLPNKEVVNQIANAIRKDATMHEHHVSVGLVVQRLLSTLGYRRFEDLGIGRVNDIEALKQISDMEDWVNTSINCFLARQSMCTLYELESLLVNMKGKSTYAELFMGSLLKHPIVIREFQPPPDVCVIPKVTAYDCAAALADIMRKRKSHDVSIQPKDIVDRLMAAKGVANPLALCVKIKGIGLYVSQISNVTRNEYSKLKTIVPEIEREQSERRLASEKNLRTRMEEIFQATMFDETKLEKSLYEYLLGTSTGSRQGVNCPPIIKYITSHLDPLITKLGGVKSITGKKKVKAEKKKLKDIVSPAMDGQGEEVEAVICSECNILQEQFIWEFLEKDTLGRALVQSLLVVISQSSSADSREQMKNGDLVLSLGSFLHICPRCKSKDMSSPSESAPADSESRDLDQTQNRCDKRELLNKVATHLQRCTRVTSVRDLAKLEADVVQDLHADAFDVFGLGSFLTFISDHTELSASLDSKGVLCRASIDHDEVLEVVSQARRALAHIPNESDIPENELLMSVLRRHFQNTGNRTNISNSNIADLESIIGISLDLEHNAKASTNILHSAALFAGYAEIECSHMPNDDLSARALQLLTSAPFLQDLALWMHWDAAFESTLGSLQQFIGSHHEAGISCLSLGQGIIVKVNPTASPETFRSALQNHDAHKAAAEIVSIACLFDGIMRIPWGLLEATAVAGLGSISLELGEEQAARFTANAVQHLPRLFRSSLGLKIFLQPLVSALGCSRHHCHELIWKVSCKDAGLRTTLQFLGLCHGVSEWTSEWLSTVDFEEASSRTKHSEIASLLITKDSKSISVTSATDLEKVVEENTEQVKSEIVTLQVEEKKLAAQKIIEDIRSSEFGLGLQLDSVGTGLRESLNARTGRALQRLSTELYSSDSHFLLELIQNADDNTYPEGIVPELCFIKSKEHILVQNNERGFNEADIRALSDIGKSTKLKRTGYIGQKGIGFKSVFRVTDAPQIHSNGFSVAFDIKANGDLGYILPEWIGLEALNGLLAWDHSLQSEVSRWMTTIVLPLKETSCKVTNLFEDLSPALLLFLKQLRRLSIVDLQTGCRQVFWKTVLGGGVVEVCSNEKSSRYLTATCSISPKVSRLDVTVESTDVVVAIPLLRNASHLVEQQEVFSYLPVRSYGFRFVVQADFILPSSREAVDRDSPWNQRLRAEIPAAFALAVKASKNLGDNAVESTNLWLSVLPLDHEVQDFFQPCVRAIHALVRTLDCIPTTNLQWKTPSSIMTCGRDMLQIVDSDMLNTHLNIHLAHADLLPKPLAALGIGQVSSITIMDLLKCGAYQTLDQLAAVLSYLAECYKIGRMSPLDVERLQTLPILMLADGQVTNALQGPVYFPPDGKEGHVILESLDEACISLSSFTKILHPNLYKDANGNKLKPAYILLERIGVQTITFQRLIEEHILSEFKSQDIIERSKEILVSYLSLACSFWHRQRVRDQEEFIESFRTHAVVITDKGAVRLCDNSSLHFSSDFGSKLQPELLKTLIAMNWNFVHAIYIQNSKISFQIWRKFLKSLGVADFITVQSRQLTIKSLQDSGKLAPFIQSLQASTNAELILEDKFSPELEQFFKEILVAKDRCRILLTVALYFNQYWDEEGYCNLLHARVDGCHDVEIPSSFHLTLIETPWLIKGEGLETYSPPSLWSRGTRVREIFEGLDIPYIHKGLTNETFLSDIKVQMVPDVHAVLRELRRWSEDPDFRAQPTEMSKVYHFLSNQFRTNQVLDLVPSQVRSRYDLTSQAWRKVDLEKEIQNQFIQHKLVFLPHKPCTRLVNEDGNSGSFHSLDVLRIKDKTKVIEKQPESPLRIVGEYYNRSSTFDAQRLLILICFAVTSALPITYFRHRFFYEDLGRNEASQRVLLRPSVEDYVSILKLMSTTPKWSSEDLMHTASIFAYFASNIESEFGTVHGFKQVFSKYRDLSIFPARDGGWCAAQGAYINDEEDVAKQFLGIETIRFVHDDLFAKDGHVAAFCHLCDIPLLSKSVTKMTTPYHSYPDATLRLLIRDVISPVQRWLFWTKPERYNTVAAEVEKYLKSFRAYLCDEVLQLSNLAGKYSAPLPRPVAFVAEGNDIHLYVSRTSAADHHAIFLELSRWFNEGLEDPDLALFATAVNATRATGTSIERLLKHKRCWGLFPCDSDAQEQLAKEHRELPTMEWDLPLPPVETGLDRLQQYLTEDLTDALPVVEPRSCPPKHGPVASWPPVSKGARTGNMSGHGTSERLHTQEGAGTQDGGVDLRSISGGGAGGHNGDGAGGKCGNGFSSGGCFDTKGRTSTETGSVDGRALSTDTETMVKSSTSTAGGIGSCNVSDRTETECRNVSGHSGGGDETQSNRIAERAVDSARAEELSCSGVACNEPEGQSAGVEGRKDSTRASSEGFDHQPSLAGRGRTGTPSGAAGGMRGIGGGVCGAYDADASICSRAELSTEPAGIMDQVPEPSPDDDMDVVEMDLDTRSSMAAAAGRLPEVTRCLLSPEVCEGIGKYGEALVAAHLLRTAPEGLSVEWLNAEGESGAFCDIVTKVFPSVSTLAASLLHS
jgi:hypothetical protein